MQSMMKLFNILWCILLNMWDDAGRRFVCFESRIDIHSFFGAIRVVGCGGTNKDSKLYEN